MDTITINEGLLVMLAGRDGIDGTNAIELMRRAQDRLGLVRLLGRGYEGETEMEFLNKLRPMEEVDDILIAVTRNGRVDLFGN